MSRRTLNIIGILILMGITSVVSVLAYTYIIGGSGEPSQPISAPTLSANATEDPEIAALKTQVAELQAANATLSAANAAAGIAVPTLSAESATEEAAVEAEAESASASAASVVYRIVPEESRVSFTLTEDLRGQPTTVVGTTNQVAGDILVNFADPASSQVGMIRINARTLVTDQEFRNRAIRAEILQSAQDVYEFIEFTPTAITGLPETVDVGQTVSFQIVGDLKIRDIVQSVTFDATATLVSSDRLEGSATAQVTRDQYGLQIPNAPGVANVSNDVTLGIEFVATQVTE
jgi:polyisoprenoid-binding protein YceI